MNDFEWSRRARTRRGYATYPGTPAGDPTSPYRPPARTELPDPLTPTPCDPSRCDACKDGRFALPAITPLSAGRLLMVESEPERHCPAPAVDAHDVRVVAVEAPRVRWWLRMTRRNA